MFGGVGRHVSRVRRARWKMALGTVTRLTFEYVSARGPLLPTPVYVV